MTERTISDTELSSRMPTPDETEYLRGLIGYSPDRHLVDNLPRQMYVEATGDDSNSGMSPSEPVKTLREAILKMPFEPKRKVIVNIGEGIFEGFCLGDGTVVPGGISVQALFSSVEFHGTMGLFTLTTGVNEGTASGGSKDGEGRYVLNKPAGAANWTVNDFVGQQLFVTGGAGPSITYVVANDANTITAGYVGPFGAVYDATTQFQIRTWLTRIDRSIPGLSSAGTQLVFANIIGTIKLIDIDFYTDDALTSQATSVQNMDFLFFVGCRFMGKATGNMLMGVVVSWIRYLEIWNCLFDKVGTSWGASVYAGLLNGNLNFGSSAVIRPPTSSTGVKGSYSTGFSRVVASYFDGNSSGDYGIYMMNKGDLTINYCLIKGFVSGGIYIAGGHSLEMNDVIGSGNGGYGCKINACTQVQVGSGMTVTGTSDDFIVGSTPGKWATDLATPGLNVREAGINSGYVRV